MAHEIASRNYNQNPAIQSLEHMFAQVGAQDAADAGQAGLQGVQNAHDEKMAKLKAMLLGQQEEHKKKLEQDTKKEDLQRALDTYKAGGLPAGSHIKTGEASISEPDPTAMALRAFLLKNSVEDKQDKKVKELGERFEKSKIPEMMSQIDTINAASADASGKGALQEGGHLKSLGGMKNMVPDALVPIAEKFGLMQPGSAQERQAYNAVKNAAMHAQFGARQTEAEKAMLMKQLGDNVGNTEENMIAGLKSLQNQSSREGQNIVQSTNPKIVDIYKNRGGSADFKTDYAPVGPKTPQTGPHGDIVQQGGHTYKWNPTTNQYE